jgi:TonB family protein
MTTKLTLFVCLIIVFSFLPARAQSGPESWKRYTVPGQEFSVALPTPPAMSFYPQTDDSRWWMVLGVYADEVIYTIGVYENMREQQSLADLIAEQSAELGLDATTQKRILVNGVTGKEYLPVKLPPPATCQFFEMQQRFYRFCVAGAPADDPRARGFFSSIAFGEKQDGIAVSDGPGTPYHLDPDETPFVGKEVELKIRLGMKPEPLYTDAARRNQITGTVVLKAVFTSAGNVSNIRIVSGLPYGLTERAIAAAKKIKFIPAVKDGHYVSVWMQLEYNFNLY